MDSKEEGNKLFQEGSWSEAVEQYSKGLAGAEALSDDLRLKLHSNRSQCYLNLMRWQEALDDSQVCLSIDEYHMKSILRRATALEALGSPRKALRDFAAVFEEEPKNDVAQRGVKRLRKLLQREQRTLKVTASLISSSLAADLTAMLDELLITDVSVNQSKSLNDYSILANVALERKQSLVERCKGDPFIDRAMGSMCGMGIGDGVGHMYEFLPCRDTPGERYFDLSTMQFYGESNTFRLKHGQWTDDSSMGLCIADSLIIRKGYDGSDIRQRFWSWWERGYNNAFRLDKERKSKHSVGLGGNISNSLADMDHLSGGEMPPPTYEATGEDSGNGSLMRFAPVAMFFHAVPYEDLHHFARQSSYTTHPGIIAAEACALLAHLIVRALKRPVGVPVDAKVFLEDATAEYLQISGLEKKAASGDWHYQHLFWLTTGRPARDTERCWTWRESELGLSTTLRARGSSYNGYPVSAGYFGSYSLDGLGIALWAVYNTTSFDEAVVKAVNTLGDADSHGSICGQLAGALYGLSSAHTQFLEWLNRWDEHEFACRAVLLHELGSSLASVAPGALRSD